MSEQTTKHEPGPWKHGRYECVTPGLVPDAYAIWPASVEEGALGTPVALVSPMATLSETDLHNAHLIAAAPGLLAACRLVLEEDAAPESNGGMLTGLTRERLRAAIAKAEGR